MAFFIIVMKWQSHISVNLQTVLAYVLMIVNIILIKDFIISKKLSSFSMALCYST